MPLCSELSRFEPAPKLGKYVLELPSANEDCIFIMEDPVRVGRTLLDSFRHDVTERLDFAEARKMRPRNMLMHPREKRKNAETRVKSSTWRERI